MMVREKRRGVEWEECGVMREVVVRCLVVVDLERDCVERSEAEDAYL